MRTLLLAAFALLGACATLPVTPQSALDGLAVPGAFLSGTPQALGPRRVLNREDFVYDARLSPDATAVAQSRLGMKSFFLTLTALDEALTKTADVAVNAIEFDVGALDWAPDGSAVATVSRDGSVRVYDAKTGALRGAWLTEEPLTTVAFHPGGTHLAVGSEKGLITVLSWPGFTWVAEARPHAEQVRGLVFARDGRLFSGGWDKKVLVHTLEQAPAEPSKARTHFEVKNGLVLFRAVLDGKASATVTPDARLPVVVVRGALAQAAGIDVAGLTDEMTIPTALGSQVARLAKGRRLTVKGLALSGLDVAVCDACVPEGVQAVLGQSVTDVLDIARDEATKEVAFTVRPGAANVAAASSEALKRSAAFELPAFVNDLSVDAAGDVLGVALSEEKGERTREVYEREKRNEVEPERPWDCGARVDARTGKVLERRHGHRGVVATAGISPDGKTLATGGWDKQVLLHGQPEASRQEHGWALRRVRFSRDGRWLVVAAWTPQNPLGDNQSDPSCTVSEVLYPAGVAKALPGAP